MALSSRSLHPACAFAALCLLLATPSRAEEDVKPSPIHFTLGLGLFGVGSPSWAFSGSAPRVFLHEDGVLADAGIELPSSRWTVEAGAAYLSGHIGLRGDWLASPSRWTPVLGGSLGASAASDGDTTRYSQRSLLLEGGLAWRSEGHTRFLAVARAGIASITDHDDHLASSIPSVRPSWGLAIQAVAFLLCARTPQSRRFDLRFGPGSSVLFSERT